MNLRRPIAAVLAATALLAVGACSEEGDDRSVATGDTTTTSTTSTTVPPPADETRPPGRTGPAGSVAEPFEAERYTEGQVTFEVELSSGSTRCLEIALDVEASGGWLFDSNEIDLRYGADDRAVAILTYGEPMSDQVDARVRITLPEGEFAFVLDGGACDRSPGLTLTGMGDGYVLGRIDCDRPDGSDEVVSIAGTFRAGA